MNNMPPFDPKFIEEMKKQNLITKNEDVLTLTTKGMLIADEIIKKLLL